MSTEISGLLGVVSLNQKNTLNNADKALIFALSC
jgi:hypothetical protein